MSRVLARYAGTLGFDLQPCLSQACWFTLVTLELQRWRIRHISSKLAWNFVSKSKQTTISETLPTIRQLLRKQLNARVWLLPYRKLVSLSQTIVAIALNWLLSLRRSRK